MSMHDLRTNILVSNALDYTNITATGNTDGEILDMQGYKSATFALRAGTITDGVYTPSLLEGSATGSMSAVSTAEVIGVSSANTIGSADDNGVVTLGYVGSKRYVQLRVAATGVSTGGNVLANAILGYAQDNPVTEG